MNFKEHLSSWLSKEEIDSLINALNEKESKHAVLLNTKKMSDENFIKLFPNVIPHPIVNHAYLYNKNEYDFGKSIYHELGAFYLQDPSAMSVAYLLGFDNDDKVLDMCAAPGGKTVQASMILNDSGLIISNDLSRSRAGLILENVERLGLGNVIITNNDFSLIKNKYENTFDKIILDAPCSGSGMFRKQREMEDDWTYQKVLKFAEIQKELIINAYFMLKPGGKMSYSTCSFSKEENEDIIQYLLSISDAKIINIEGCNLYKYNDVGYHFLPSLFPGEGQYVCVIQKPGKIEHKAPEKIATKMNKNLNVPESSLHKYGDTLFMFKSQHNFKGLNIIREGVKVGELTNDIIKFDHHYASYISSFDNTLEINPQDLVKYFAGESLNIKIDKGFVLLKYNGINIDIAKSDGNIIKNRLPKYLRKKISA